MSSIVTGIFRGGSAIAQAQMQANMVRQQAQFQQQMAERQAQLEELKIARERTASAFEQQQERKKQDLVRGQSIAKMSASGVNLEGSFMDVLEQQSGEDALQLMSMQYSSQTRQEDFKASAVTSRFEGRAQMQLGSLQARNIRTAGKLEAVGHVLQGVSNTAKQASMAGGGG